MSLPDFLTNRAVVTQLLGLAAVHHMSKRSLRERTANLTLTPPLLTNEDKSKIVPVVETTPTIRRPWYRKVFSKKTAMAMVPMLVMLGIQFIVIWVLPRITSALVLDIFWGSVSGWIISGVLATLLTVFAASQPATRLIRGTDSKLHIKHELAHTLNPDAKPALFDKKRNVRIASYVLAAGFIGLTYHDDRNYLIPVVASAWVIHLFHSVVFPRISVRVMTKVTLGFLSVCAAVFGIVFTLSIMWPSHFDPKAAKKEKSTLAEPDRWVLTLMMLPSDIIASVPVAILVSLTMRYDHFHLTSSPHLTLGPTKAAPGEIVPIPLADQIESRPTPLYNIAMISFAACHLASDGITAYLFQKGIMSSRLVNANAEIEATCKLGSFVLANLFVPGVVALAAWWRGELGDWWGYHEEWIPQVEDDSIEQSEINDAEKALDPISDLSTIDEKKSIPVV